jgi:ribosomal-protein-alanine N-acetyltransferase
VGRVWGNSFEAGELIVPDPDSAVCTVGNIGGAGPVCTSELQWPSIVRLWSPTAPLLLMPAPPSTPRLLLEPFSNADAAWVLRLLNDPGFLLHIGDRGVRTEAESLAYLQNGIFYGLSADGFGLRKLVLRDQGIPVGVCGLLRRPHLDGPDLGYALLAEHTGRGYAHEAAVAMLRLAWEEHLLQRVLAIVKPANKRSTALLQRLGFEWIGAAPPSPPTTQADPPLLSLYAVSRPPTPPTGP